MVVLDPLSFWFLLPVGVLIATLYTSTGISGANFWAPVYLLWLNLEPRVAFWLALVSMLFGSLAGLVRHLQQGTIDFYLVKRYLRATIPAAILGALLVPIINVRFLILFFGVFVLLYGLFMLYQLYLAKQLEPHEHQRIHYLLGAVGGFTTGLISVGLGKLILPHCIRHKRVVHHAQAVGTVLVIVFVTSLIAVLTRLNSSFIEALKENIDVIGSMLIYVIPGVLIGGLIGPRVAKKLPIRMMRVYVAGLLLIVGSLALFRAF